MVRIPRTEAQVGFQPSQQPTWSSGSASAPGKAVASLGNAIGDLGSAFTAEINQKNEFDDKLKVLQFQNQWEHDQVKDLNEFNRDDPSGFATERYGSYRQGVQSLLPQLKSEKTKQWAMLHLENHGSNVYERYQKFEYGKIGDKLYRDIDATITGEFGKPTLNNPDTIVKDIEGTLAGVEAIIKSSPGMVPDNRKEALRKAAADLALKKLDEVMTSAGREDELYDVTQGILKRMGIDPAAKPAAAPGPQSALPPMFDRRAPTMAERQKIFQSGGVVVNLDTNWAKGETQTTPMVVIPDNATPAQRQAAEAYAQGIAGVYKEKFGSSLAPRVVTRSENGRGRGFTIHTEPYSVNDSRAVSFFNSPEGRSAHAKILQDTFGKIPGVHFSIPHDPDKGDRGAHGKGGNEVDFAVGLLEHMRGGGGGAATAQAGKPLEGIAPKLTAYAPQAGGPLAKMEGGYAAARPGPDGKAVVRTLEDLQQGRSNHITIAGDPSQYGKTFTIPEITWIDGRGQKHTSKNVKAVVHDTGSAFKGAGDSKFDIPVARDLTNAQMAAQPFLKGGVRFLGGPGTEAPASVADLPEKQRVSLAGLDPKAKAAKLEELVGQGYQSVIHQLDNNGEDVLIVRKSDKPEWYKNFRGTGKGPSEFDKPDFAGPEWAGESIRKIRAGEVRPQNTIPGAGTKVADASGNVVPIKPGMAVPGQQSAQSQFQEGLVRQLPALAKRSELAKERWAKDISGQIKTIVDMAEKGYAPRDEDIAKLEEQLIRKPDLAQRYGLTDAALGAQEFVNQQMQIRTLRPVELEAGLRAVQVEAQTNGATPELIKRKERMEKLLGEMRKGVNEDPIGWADRVGVAKADPIDWTKPESLANRVALARTVAEHYGQPPQFFTKQERDELKDRLKIGGKQMLGMLGAMHQAFGPDTIYAMAEISKQAPEAATIGWMMSKGIAPQVVEDAAIGMERQAKRAMGEKGIVPIKPVEGRTAFIDVAGNAFSRLPSSEGALVETVNAAYEARAQRMGWAEPKADEWKKIMREVVGESTDKQGNVYGGFQSFGSGHKIILPPEVKNVEGTFRNSGNSFRMLMDAVRPEDLVNEFGSGPASGNNTPLSIGAVRNATPISVGEGRYLLAMGDPSSDPMLVQDGAGNNFVLDLNALKDKLKARRPDLYQGYERPMPGVPSVP